MVVLVVEELMIHLQVLETNSAILAVHQLQHLKVIMEPLVMDLTKTLLLVVAVVVPVVLVRGALLDLVLLDLVD
jgi:hypothetical protein